MYSLDVVLFGAINQLQLQKKIFRSWENTTYQDWFRFLSSPRSYVSLTLPIPKPLVSYARKQDELVVYHYPLLRYPIPPLHLECERILSIYPQK